MINFGLIGICLYVFFVCKHISVKQKDFIPKYQVFGIVAFFACLLMGYGEVLLTYCYYIIPIDLFINIWAKGVGDEYI